MKRNESHGENAKSILKNDILISLKERERNTFYA
jgi:hypothetical protein